MLIRSFVSIIAAITILFTISWQLTLAMLGSILPVIIFGGIYGNAMKKIQMKIQDKKAECSTIAEESFSNIRTVKAFATEEHEQGKFRAENDQVYQWGRKKALWYGAFNFIA